MSNRLWNRDDKDLTIIVGNTQIMVEFYVLYISLKTFTTFQVHKNVLASCSEVFETMLKTGWKEGDENKVIIDDFDAPTVQAAVEYCYDQEMTNVAQVAVDLYRFADKYFMDNLKVS